MTHRNSTQHHVHRNGSRHRPKRLIAVAASLAALAALATGCVDKGTPPLLSGPGEYSIGLRTDMSCDELVDETRSQLSAEFALAEAAMNQGMVESEEGVGAIASADMGSAEAGSDSAAPTTTAGTQDLQRASGDDESAGGEVVSGTNNQEQGVDEADLVKTDGRRIVSLLDGVLRVVELDDSPHVVGTIDLMRIGVDGGDLFLRGDEALLLLPSWGNPDYDVPTAPVPETAVPQPAPTIEDQGSVDGVTAPVEAPRSTPETTTPVTPETTVPPGDETTSTGVPTTTTAPTTAAPTTIATTTSTTSTTTTSTTTTTTVVEPPQLEPLPFASGVRLLRIDMGELGSGAQPKLVEQRSVEGELVAARMIDGTVRVVVRSPQPVNDLMYDLGEPEAAREAIGDITTADVLPRATDDSGNVVSLGECGDVATLPAIPAEVVSGASSAVDAVGLASSYGQPTNVSVLTIRDDLTDLTPTTVAGLADVVYATVDSVYVTSTGWNDNGAQTLIHRFALPADGPADYTGSAAVPGTPLNQYSLSEQAGDLRIVTTTDGGFSSSRPTIATDPGVDGGDGVIDIAPAPLMATEGRLTILRPDDSGTFSEIGAVEDLGIGETVQSVRFLGDMAYVVTFRQTDPLYAIDLSDPANPKALGELKITGFSEYLHPVGDGLLLGVGREATVDGMDTGFKASLFDVSDPTNPTEVDKVVLPDAWSPVGDDPLAFGWDPVAGNAIIPIERSSCPPNADCMEGYYNAGALVLSVDGDSLEEVATLSHPGGTGDSWTNGILRSMVIDRDLWTLSRSGLGKSNADNPTGLLMFPF